MKERPILFSAAMVCALLDGSKTQTRRVVKITHKNPGLAACLAPPIGEPRPGTAAELCPYGQPGQRLWVRETWYCDHFEVQKGPYLEVPEARELLVYRADNERPYEAEQPVWRPSIHMPRWASRILLEIVSVRVERLSDCSEADAKAEGVAPNWIGPLDKGPNGLGGAGWSGDDYRHYTNGADGDPAYSARESFESLWESINGAGSWAVNPWVWVIEFKRVTP